MGRAMVKSDPGIELGGDVALLGPDFCPSRAQQEQTRTAARRIERGVNITPASQACRGSRGTCIKPSERRSKVNLSAEWKTSSEPRNSPGFDAGLCGREGSTLLAAQAD